MQNTSPPESERSELLREAKPRHLTAIGGREESPTADSEGGPLGCSRRLELSICGDDSREQGFGPRALRVSPSEWFCQKSVQGATKGGYACVSCTSRWLLSRDNLFMLSVVVLSEFYSLLQTSKDTHTQRE